MSILYKTTRFADTFTGDKETNVRVQLLSWDTLDTKAFVEYLATKYNLSKGEAYKSLSIVLEGMEAVLKDGNILNLDDFGSFSLNGNFCEDKEPDENRPAPACSGGNVGRPRAPVVMSWSNCGSRSGSRNCSHRSYRSSSCPWMCRRLSRTSRSCTRTGGSRSCTSSRSSRNCCRCFRRPSRRSCRCCRCRCTCSGSSCSSCWFRRPNRSSGSRGCSRNWRRSWGTRYRHRRRYYT